MGETVEQVASVHSAAVILPRMVIWAGGSGGGTSSARGPVAVVLLDTAPKHLLEVGRPTISSSPALGADGTDPALHMRVRGGALPA